MGTILTIVGYVICGLVVLAVIHTLVDIHRKFGISSPRGGLWALAVIVGNLFGIILYRFFRQPVENLVQTMTQRY